MDNGLEKNKDIQSLFNDVLNEAVSQFSDEKTKMNEYWEIFHGDNNLSKFKYLTNTDGLTYPAKFRNIGAEIVRSKLQLLYSKQSRRTFNFKAVSIDERSLEEKIKDQIKARIKAIKDIYEDRNNYLDAQIKMVQNQIQEVYDKLKIQPENEEMQMQLQQIQQNLPMIEYEFGKVISLLNKEKIDNNEFNEKFNNALKYSQSEIIQHVANAAIKSAIQTEDLLEQWNSGLRENTVTGKPTFLSYYNPKTKDVVFRQIEANNAYYSKGGNNRFTNTGEWFAFKEWMDVTQIGVEFDLTEEQYNLLRDYREGNTNLIQNYSNNSAYFAFNNFENTYYKDNKVEVWRAWINVPRKIYYKKSPNKHSQGEYFWNLTDEKYIAKKGEEKKSIDLYDQYYCVLIGGIIFINNGTQNYVFRPKDVPGLPYLPGTSRTFNSISEKPYSLIAKTKDLIELYNIINYKKELAIALAGVRGMIMDKSQKPDNMKTDLWIYYRRLGTMWIETMKKGRKIPSTFNQFQTYDDSLNDSFSLYDAALAGIENLMSKIIGISPASLGQMVSKDPVKSVEMSQESTDLLTETIFYENDKIFALALEQYLNLKIQYVWNEGKVLNYMNPDLEEVITMIPKGMLKKSDFRIYTKNSIKEDNDLENLKRYATQVWSSGQISVDSIGKIIKANDIDDLSHTLTTYVNKAEQLKQEYQKNIDENKAKLNQETEQLKFQLNSEIEKIRNQSEMIKAEIDKANLELDTAKFQWESDFKERELSSKTETERMKVASQNEIESSYLQEEARSNRIQEALKSFEIKINAMLDEMSIRSGEITAARKIDVDKEKNMRNKVNLR